MERNIFCKFEENPIPWRRVVSHDVIVANMTEKGLKFADVSENCEQIMQ